MTEHFEVIIIGTGQAGPALAARCSEQGLKTVIIERKAFGGTCVNTGCIPTKTLLASARAAHMARRGKDFGFTVHDKIDMDMPRVKARKDALVHQSTTGVEKRLCGLEHVSVLRGHARFTSPRAVRVDGRELTAERIFVNVGARAFIPDMPGLSEVAYFTNSTILEVDFLPEHLIVIGGSYIGLEFAQMYRRFGSQVTVCERASHLISREDEDVSDAIRDILEREGIAVRTDAECLETRKRGSRLAVQFACHAGAPEVEGTHLLLAVGRQPNTDDLGLEVAGIAVDDKGYIKVDDQLRTNVDNVWALGEVNGRGAFTHTAYNDYEIVAANLFDGGSRKLSDRITAYALFIDPPLGRVGMSEKEARTRSGPVSIAKWSMADVGRAREMDETQGFMKVLVDTQTQRILGAALLGLHADECVHSLLDLMYADQPYTVLQRAVHIHPTVQEFMPTLLEALQPLST